MTDLNIAKEHLQNNDLSVVIVKDELILETSNAKGIKPLFDIYSNRKEILRDASVADRVIGKAAAMIVANGGIKNLYAEIISEKAIEILKEYDIEFEYGKKVPIILNRDGSDLCPIEKLSQNTKDVDELIEKIKMFLENISRK